jgi:hypothetical protein
VCGGRIAEAHPPSHDAHDHGSPGAGQGFQAVNRP